MRNSPRLLILDDDEPFARDLSGTLGDLGYRVFRARNRADGTKILMAEKILVVLLGMNRSKETAFEELSRIKTRFPGIEVIIFAQRGQFKSAFQAMSEDAFDFLVKSQNIAEYIPSIDKACARAEKCFRTKNARGEAWARFGSNFSGMVGESRQIKKVLDLISKVAPSDISVLLLGETGTGKELAARLIHQNSRRRNGPLVVINCGAIPEALLENELFGHAKGAFTDSISLKHGLLEEADGGTLFLDEVGELPLSLQVKLLRVLETGTFRRLGENKELHINIRIVSAANTSLTEEIARRRFRADLYYRLAVMPLCIPPLRERRDDIPLLAKHFLRDCEGAAGKASRKFSKSALRVLSEYDWPGNVREVKNLVQRAAVLSAEETLTGADVSSALSLSSVHQSPLTEFDDLSRPYAAASPVPVNGRGGVPDERIIKRVASEMRNTAEVLNISPQVLMEAVLSRCNP